MIAQVRVHCFPFTFLPWVLLSVLFYVFFQRTQVATALSYTPTLSRPLLSEATKSVWNVLPTARKFNIFLQV